MNTDCSLPDISFVQHAQTLRPSLFWYLKKITTKNTCYRLSVTNRLHAPERYCTWRFEFLNFLFRKSEKEAHYQFQVIDINRSLFFDTCLKSMSQKSSTYYAPRDLFEFMVREYARQRNGMKKKHLHTPLVYLQKLEQKHARKEKIKQLFKKIKLWYLKSLHFAG